MLEICERCRRTIGNNEEVCVWQDSPVCKECHTFLTASSPIEANEHAQQSSGISRGTAAAILVIASMVAIIATVIVLRVLEKKNNAVIQGQYATNAKQEPSRPNADLINSTMPRRAPEELRVGGEQLSQRMQESVQEPTRPMPPTKQAIELSQVSPSRQSLEPPPPPKKQPPPRYTEGNLVKEIDRMKASIEAAFPTIPPDRLVGQRFIIARNTSYEDDPDKPFLSLDLYKDHQPLYKDVVEKECVLIKLELKAVGEGATIQMDGTGKQYGMMASLDGLPIGLILANDVKQARVRWKGQFLWYRGDTLLLEKKTLRGATQVLKVKRCSKMTVVDVKASEMSSLPVEFVLRTPSGEQGYIPVAMSETTVPTSLRGRWTFYTTFLETDPRVLCPHPPEIWDQIENKHLSIGMNKEQVLLSWGEPDDIKTTVTADGRREQWIYSRDRYVYFTDGAVSTIQD